MPSKETLPIGMNSTPPSNYTAVIKCSRLCDLLLLKVEDRALDSPEFCSHNTAPQHYDE